MTAFRGTELSRSVNLLSNKNNTIVISTMVHRGVAWTNCLLGLAGKPLIAFTIYGHVPPLTCTGFEVADPMAAVAGPAAPEPSAPAMAATADA